MCPPTKTGLKITYSTYLKHKIMDCNELFLEDIVRVDLVPRDRCNIRVPFNVPGILEVLNPVIGAPAMSIGFEGDDLTAFLEESPTMKDSEQPQAAGYIHTHELTATCLHNFAALRAATKTLMGVDFNIIAHTMNGTRYLCYALPNTARVNIDDQMGTSASMTVKAKLNAMSGFIRIVTTEGS